MSNLVLILSNALTQAAIVVLIALGFLLIFKATGIVNFAQGDLATLAAYIAYWCTKEQGWNIWLSYGLTIVALFVVGVVLERFAYAPLRHRSVHVIVVSTLGAALVIRAGITLWQGNTPLTTSRPFGYQTFTIAGTPIPYQSVLIIVAAGIGVAAMLLVFERTAFGRQVRALASDRLAAQLQGVEVGRMSMVTFGIAAALSGLAGILIAPTQALTPQIGFTPMILAFAAAIVGGFGRLIGVVVGAVVLELVLQAGGVYLSSSFAELFPFLLVLIIIAWRPQGLFGDEIGARL